MSICNPSLARLDDSSRNRAFWRGYPNLMHLYGGLLEPRGQTLHRWNLRLMPNISCAVVLVYLERLFFNPVTDNIYWSRAWRAHVPHNCSGRWYKSRRNSLLKCVLQPKIAKKITKPPILGVQGHSRSSMLVPLERSSAVVVRQHVCVYLQPFSH